MEARRDPASLGRNHGPHTLRVWRGTVVGAFGQDVFIELGPRMQGVIRRDHFERPPRIGDQHDFTLHGQEEGLWALSLRDEKSLDSWESMEAGSLVQARIVRLAPGGLELKIGPLHAFLPKSHTGIPRDESAQVLVGKTLTVEVLEVDPERQRVIVSRKLVVQRERESVHQREIAGLKVGQCVQGRVTRIEPYGVFVSFGHGMEGLVHISNLVHERIEHPSEVVELGATLELRVLSVRQGGKRIALGRKQLIQSPWENLEKRYYVDQIVPGRVVRLTEFGAFVELERGVEGLLSIGQCGATHGRPMRSILAVGQKVSVRVQELDPEGRRLGLSLLHKSGARITEEEAENAKSFAELIAKSPAQRLEVPLGRLLARALRASLGAPLDDRPAEGGGAASLSA